MLSLTFMYIHIVLIHSSGYDMISLFIQIFFQIKKSCDKGLIHCSVMSDVPEYRVAMCQLACECRCCRSCLSRARLWNFMCSVTLPKRPDSYRTITRGASRDGARRRGDNNRRRQEAPFKRRHGRT